MTRTTAALPLLALVALALAGCGPTPPPPIDTPTARPTPPATATPIPLPTPTVTLPPEAIDPLDTVTSILIQTEGTFFCDDVACGVDGFFYSDDPDEVLAKLTAVFGVEPDSQRYDNGGGNFSEYHNWGGFTIYFSTGGPEPFGMGVDVTVASIAGVAIETEHGVHVGTPMSEALELADLVYTTAGETGAIYEAHFGVDAEDANNWRAIIAFRADDTEGPVMSIAGPIGTGDISGPAAGF